MAAFYRLTIKPLSAFASPVLGATLFGQTCWFLRQHYGNVWLTTALSAYTSGQPFLVVGDPVPTGYLPLPLLPRGYWNTTAATEKADHKQLKKKKWLSVDHAAKPLADWQALAVTDADIYGNKAAPQAQAYIHNTINRATGTTGTGLFAPYITQYTWYDTAESLDFYIAVDEAILTSEQMIDVLTMIGQTGYGADASIGYGRFSITDLQTVYFDVHANSNAYLALGGLAPQGLACDPAYSFYQPHVHFGRHGGPAVHSGNPFKRPLIIAKMGGVFSPNTGGDLAINVAEKQTLRTLGCGLADVSFIVPETVHQGYAPVLPVYLKR